MYISKHQYVFLAITICYVDDLFDDFFLFSLSVLHGIPAYRWEIGGRNDLYTYIYPILPDLGEYFWRAVTLYYLL
jgi:hypothetical protein